MSRKENDSLRNVHFEDISSHSPGVGPSKAEEEWRESYRQQGRKRSAKRESSAGSPAAVRKTTYENPRSAAKSLPSRDEVRERNQRKSAQSQNYRGNTEIRRQKGKEPRRHGGVLILLILLMIAVTAALVVFLLFKVATVEVTGDVIEGVSSEAVISACGFEAGDNLVFLPVEEAKNTLKSEFPYIGEVEIIRHLPDTLEIKLTAAAPAASLYSNGQWTILSSDGKILEKGDAAMDGTVKVLGLDLSAFSAGETVSEDALSSKSSESSEISETDSSQSEAKAFSAFSEVTKTIEDSNASGSFTWLDLSDLSDIKLIYEDRVEFRLGNVLELSYKIDLGIRSISEWDSENPENTAKGYIDLSQSADTKTAIFTEGTITTPDISAETAAGSDGTASDAGDGTDAEPTPSPEPEESSSTRADGIPETPYTGE